ncbi:MAG: methylmalonyl-CoA mutase family protein [Nitritalea sp.]
MKHNLFEAFPPLSKADWIAQINKDLRGKPFQETLVSQTREGLVIAPAYTAEDIEYAYWAKAFRYRSQQDVTALGYSPRHWTTVAQQRIQPGEEATANKRLLEQLQQGVDGLHLQLSAEVDFELLFSGVGLPYISVYLAPEGDPVALLRHFLRYADQAGCTTEQLQGGMLYDPVAVALRVQQSRSDALKTFLALTELSVPFPHFYGACVDFQAYHSSGANAIQETLYALAGFQDLLLQAEEKGYALGPLARQVFLRGSAGAHYFPEIAKIRAQRILFQSLLALADVAVSSEEVHQYVASSYWTKTRRDVYTNMLRNTTEAMAALLGGANALEVLPHTVAKAEASNFDLRMARNISSILRDESYLDKVVDPLAGAYLIENLIEQLCREVKKQWEALEQKRGWWEAYTSGTLQAAVRQARVSVQEAVASGQQVMVGVNRYTQEEAFEPEGSVEEAAWQLLPARASSLVEHKAAEG